MEKVSVEECQKISIQNLKVDSLSTSPIEVNGQLIELTKTECNYGGNRFWFLCPNCNRRTGVLYRKPLAQEFICRYCNSLTYNLRKYHRSSSEYFLKSVHKIRKEIVR